MNQIKNKTLHKGKNIFILFLFLCAALIAASAQADGFGVNGDGEGLDEKAETCDSCTKACGSCAKPVSLYTGVETHTVTDATLNGPFPLSLTRHYDGASDYLSPLGYGWAFIFDRRLYEYPDNSIVIRNGTGQRPHFIKSGGVYITPANTSAGTLTEELDELDEKIGYLFTYPSGRIDRYDLKGLLVSQTDAEGNKLLFSYSTTKKGVWGTTPYAIDPANVKPVQIAHTYQLESVEQELSDGTTKGSKVIFHYNNGTNGDGRLTSIDIDDDNDATPDRSITYTHETMLVGATHYSTGNLVEVEGLDGMVSNYEYDIAANHPTLTANQIAHKSINYDFHDITSIQEGEGSTPYINSYDEEGRIVEQTHGNDVYTFTYNVDLIETDVSHTIVNGGTSATSYARYIFNEYGFLDKQVDAFANEIRYRYNTKGALIRKEYWQRSAQSLPASKTVWTGRITENQNNTNIGLQHTVDYHRDNAGNIVYQAEGKTVFPGDVVIELLQGWGPAKVTETEYEQGRVTRIKEYEVDDDAQPTGQEFVTEYTYYTESGIPTRLQDIKRQISSGNWYTETRSYEARGLLSAVTYPDGNHRVYEYDSGSLYPTRVYWHIGGTIDSSGYPTGGTASDVEAMDLEWDARGNVTKVTDARSKVTLLGYDDSNRLTSITNALSEQTLLGYNDYGLLESLELGKVTGLDGIQVEYTYTAEKKLYQVKRDSDVLMTYTYDSAGRRVKATDANNNDTLFAWNALDHLTSITDANSNASTYSYDMLGNRTQATNALTQVTNYSYDPLNRLVQMTEVAASATTLLQYDARNNVTAVTDAEGSTTTYSYNGLSQLLTETRPLEGATTYDYDNRQRLDTVIQPAGNLKDYGYYNWGGLHTVETYDDTPTLTRTQTYGYDDAGNITSITDDGVQATEMFAITYDDLNRPDVRTIKYLPGGNRTLDYSYDRFGNKSGVVYTEPGSNDFTHTYTSSSTTGLLSSASLGGNSLSLAYYDNDQLHTLTRSNTIIETLTYKANGPLDELEIAISGGATLENLTHAYDAIKQVDTITNHASQVRDYGYDSQHHLTSATYTGSLGLTNESFTYDKVGNRSNVTTNADHQLVEDATYTYTYDDNGNMATRETIATPVVTDTYTYDENNQLTGYSNGTTTASYVYGPSNQRLKKTVNSTSTWFLYDGAQLVAETDNSGTMTKRYDYLPGSYAPVQMKEGSNVYQIHSNHLSTPFMMTNTSQSTVWTAKHKAFGETTTTGTPVLNIRYPGQYYDSETGLHYNWNRYYNNQTGKYESRDPIGLRGGVNAYGYAYQNPIMLIDLMGLDCYEFVADLLKAWDANGSSVGLGSDMVSNMETTLKDGKGFKPELVAGGQNGAVSRHVYAHGGASLIPGGSLVSKLASAYDDSQRDDPGRSDAEADAEISDNQAGRDVAKAMQDAMDKRNEAIKKGNKEGYCPDTSNIRDDLEKLLRDILCD